MKKKLCKWGLRLTATALLIAGLLLTILLNPILSYGNKTTYQQYRVYHNKPIGDQFRPMLDEVTGLLKKSEFYNPEMNNDICLNDGSNYPFLVEKINGRAFARGFYNKVVIQAKTNLAQNYAVIDEYRWNLTRLLAHEMVHCMQFDRLGFWHSNPVAALPVWKWEGYAEYISRQSEQPNEMHDLINLFHRTDKDSWAVYLPDSTIIPREYLAYRMLVQYCMDIKRMSYSGLLKDTLSEEAIRQDMMKWHFQNKKN